MKISTLATRHRVIACAAMLSVTGLAALPAAGEVIGSQTITNAAHYGYFGFASTSSHNTKTTVGPFDGIAKTIRVQGTVTEVNSDAYLSSIRVLPSGGNLAGYQPGFQFSNFLEFDGTVNVSATIYAPGGVDLSSAMQFEMYSIDDEQYVPGLDATSTLTYTFDDAYPVGTAEYSGSLAQGDPTFQKPASPQLVSGSSNESVPGTPYLTFDHPFYDAQPFSVDADGSYTMASANEFESASMLYEGSFDPENPLDNIVVAVGETRNVLRSDSFNDLPYNDDAVGGTSITKDLQAGVQYYYITTAYTSPGGADDGGPFVGDYTNIITGAGTVNLGVIPVPEPSIGVLALAGLALRRRRGTAATA